MLNYLIIYVDVSYYYKKFNHFKISSKNTLFEQKIKNQLSIPIYQYIKIISMWK